MTKDHYKIEATLPLPPTSNNIYVDRAGGGRTKTTEARSWQRRATKDIMRQSDLTIQAEFDPDRMYWMDLHFFFAAVINKKWQERYKRGPKKGQRKGENKWKKIDLSNRIKLLEDTVRNAVGVDDCSTFVLHLTKDCDPDNPRVEVAMYSISGDEP
jgi:Holliday junction resolvase RusA-like endonuclease